MHTSVEAMVASHTSAPTTVALATFTTAAQGRQKTESAAWWPRSTFSKNGGLDGT
jgi:hypothetical protein